MSLELWGLREHNYNSFSPQKHEAKKHKTRKYAMGFGQRQVCEEAYKNDRNWYTVNRFLTQKFYTNQSNV